MKNTFLGILTTSALLFSACGSDSKSTESSSTTSTDTGVASSESSSTTQVASNPVMYVDLNTGQNFEYQYDTVNQVTMDVASGKPVPIYVNPQTLDTFNTQGINVNNALSRTEAGWKIDEQKMKYKSGDLKIKSKGDEIKIKDGDTKTKIEGDELKIKTDDLKVKEENGDVKVKDK